MKKKAMTKAEKEEFKYELCYDYARCRSFSNVARKHGVHPQAVKRAWEALSDEEQQSIIDTQQQSDERVAERIEQISLTNSDTHIATLNKKTIIADTLTEDAFVRKMIKARNALGDELLRRCDPAYISTIEDKNFISLIRAILPATQKNEEDNNNSENDTFRKMRNSIEMDIINKR